VHHLDLISGCPGSLIRLILLLEVIVIYLIRLLLCLFSINIHIVMIMACLVGSVDSRGGDIKFLVVDGLV
jgi:hypothetical protein